MTVPMLDSSQAAMGKVMPWIVGPVSLVVTIFLPATTQVYFIGTAFLQWAQAKLFFIPVVRKVFGLPPLITQDEDGGGGGGGNYQAPRSLTINTTAVEGEPPVEQPKQGVLSTIRDAKKRDRAKDCRVYWHQRLNGRRQGSG